ADPADPQHPDAHGSTVGGGSGGGGLRFLVVGELGAVELGGAPAGAQQLGVSAPLDHPAVVEHEDGVGGADRREPVGDDQGGAARQRRRQRLLDRHLGAGVQVGRGL